MKKRICKGLDERNRIISDLCQYYTAGAMSNVTILTGPSGSGKSYVINSLINKLTNSKKELLIYAKQGNELVSLNNLKNININSLSLSLSCYIFGGEIGVGFDNSTPQYQYIKKIFSSKKNILICIDDFSLSDNTIKSAVRIIIENFSKLKNEIDNSIYFLISDTSNNNIENIFINHSSYIDQIVFEPYEEKDILDYISNKHSAVLTTGSFEEKIQKIQKICNGNLSLVDFLFVDIQVHGNEFFDALEKIVSYRLNELKLKAQNRDISETEFEDVVFSSALCLQTFTAYDISQITSRSNDTVNNSLDIAQEGAFIDKYIDCSYAFRCPEIQAILERKSIYLRRERLLLYYQYYTLTQQDEYYYRGYYLTRYSNRITSQSFSLLLMSYISAIKTSDLCTLSSVDILFCNYASSPQKESYKRIKNFINNLQKTDCQINLLYEEYKSIIQEEFELPLLGEIACAFFHFIYHNSTPDSTIIKNVLNECVQYATNDLSLSTFNNPIGIIPTDETIIRLSIIYAILPFILDVQNDYDKFNELYDLSKYLIANAKSTKEKGLAQYIQSVFNQKAFLFVNQTQCGIFYKKAKLFFQKNNLWVDYCITLVCEAGTNIVIQEYSEAIRLCKKALEISSKEEIVIPQIAKLKNNMLISDFLLFESNTVDEKKCKQKAKQTCIDLIDELDGSSCATQFVLLTNICSLSLYCDNEKQYFFYKRFLEKQLMCRDLSNIFDNDIDDFYRYYFAWFEIYRLIRIEQWEEAEKRARELNGFVPALFKKQEQFWDKKNEALMSIISQRITISSYDFCNRLVLTDRRETVLSKFFFRGLMLSDLQYTSLR